MDKLPYNPPVKRYDFRGVLSIVDAQNKTVLEIVPQSRDISYEKRLNSLVALVIDLLNGDKMVEHRGAGGGYAVGDLTEQFVGYTVPPLAVKPKSQLVKSK